MPSARPTRGHLLLWLLLTISYSSQPGVVEAAKVQLAGGNAVQHPDGKVGLLVPLSVRPGQLRQQGRHLLKHGALTPVLGAVTEGYFYAQLLLGTPPQKYSTIIDTGSSITYIPCSKCRSCGKHMASPFDPSKSSTAHWLGCSDKQCQCGNPVCSCRENTCYYMRHYAEKSSSEGWMVSDKLHLPAVNSSGSGSKLVDVVFGCENVETGEIYKQRVDGVLGMGNNPHSLPQQLARSGVIENTFALCYGFPQGGSMLLGELAIEPQPKLVYTSFVSTPHSYYTIATQSISLNGKKLDINPADFSKGYGTVLDSGTTFTYLPSSAYKAFSAALQAVIQKSGLRRASGSDPSYNDVCWEGDVKDWDAVDKLFPRGNMTFADGAYIELVPYRYLFGAAPGQYCLGVFDNGWQGTLLGGIITRNVLVQYDKEKNRVGFGHTNCNAIKPAAQQAQQGSDAAAPARQGAQTDQAGTEQHHDQQQGPASTGNSEGADGSAQHERQQQQQQQQAGRDDEQGPDVAGNSSSGHGLSANRKLLWLGVAVGALLVLAIVQLAFATFWQPPAGSGKAGSNGGGLLPRAFGGEHRSYQQVETTDDQELVEFSERALRVQSAATSTSDAQQQPGQS